MGSIGVWECRTDWRGMEESVERDGCGCGG